MVSDMYEKAQPSLAPPSFVAAEQIEARIAAAEPLSMTQEEVETMAKGGSSTRKIVERLAAQGAAADVHSEKASPVAVTADDLAKIEKSGALPAKLRQRLEESRSERRKNRSPARLHREVRADSVTAAAVISCPARRHYNPDGIVN